MSGQSAHFYEFGPFRVDARRRQLLRNGEPVPLTPKALDTLLALVQNPGRVLEKDELLKMVWPDSFVEEAALTQNIALLRKALGERPAEHRYITTIPGRGYRFVASVRECSDAVLVVEEQKQISNLPGQITRLIGREQELNAAGELFRRDDVRLLNLTGAGGIGKTRLALQLAANEVPNFEDGVYFVALAAVRDPELAISTISQVLGVRESGTRTALESLKEYLRPKHILLLADNFEQVIAAAPTLAELLGACPRLKILVTSRAVLRVRGEQEFPLPPLRTADPNRLPGLEALVQYPGIALFRERAMAVQPSFSITAENMKAVAEICARLDGLPLAIELAAARIKLLPPQAMLRRLENRFQLLTRGASDVPPRQQTLRSAIDWSYELLDSGEKTVLRRLSVFPGGCTLEAAEAVLRAAGDPGVDVLEGLASLADKNLIRQEEQGPGEPRILMLETIRAYGWELLVATGEAKGMRHWHAAHYLALAEAAAPKFAGMEQGAWLNRLEADHDNLRAALQWLIESRSAEQALRLVAALWQFWEMRGYFTEGRERLAEVLSMPEAAAHTKDRLKALYGAGILADGQGDYLAARSLLQEHLDIDREFGDQRAIATSINNLGIIALRQGDYAAARALYQGSLRIFRQFGAHAGIAWSLNNLGHVALYEGDYPSARALYEESLSVSEDLGDMRSMAWSFSNLGDVAREEENFREARSQYERSLSLFQSLDEKGGMANCMAELASVACHHGEYARAASLYQESLVIFGELGDKRGIARVLEGFAGLAAARGRALAALRLAGAGEAVRISLGAASSLAEKGKRERQLEPARKSLSQAAAAAAWREGLSMPLEQAIESALESARN